MNVLVLSGRLTKDFEYKNEMARSSIAVDTFKGGTMFVDITTFKSTAEYCVKYLRKGDLIVLEGELNIFKKDTKTYVSCNVSTIQSLGSKKAKSETQESGISLSEPKEVDITDEEITSITDDDLPF